jgi:NAD-dependent dihydropyrimidine dehydrogenase PreA subunit
MMQIDFSKCTACGQCLEVCPVGAISLVKGRAVIDPETCIICGACTYSCPHDAISEAPSPETAITATIQPAKIQSATIETSKLVPAAQPAGRMAWAMPVISFLGKEIIPRLADSFLDSLDRHFSASAKNTTPLDMEISNPSIGQGHQMRRRRRGRMM